MDDITITLELEAFKKENEELTKEVANLKRTLWEYGITEVSQMSDEEYICVKEIARLRKLSDSFELSENEVKMFDLLNKNLRMIRSNIDKKQVKGKPVSAKELLKLVDGGDND